MHKQNGFYLHNKSQLQSFATNRSLNMSLRVTIAVITYHDQKQAGVERVYLAFASISLKEVKTGTQRGKEPGGMS